MQLSNQLKIALVGCGGIAQAHWRGIQAQATQLVVSAVVDTDPARAAAMAEQTGGQPFTTLESALEQGDFAAVDIMLPHNQHEAAAISSFAAGKHVVLESPWPPRWLVVTGFWPRRNKPERSLWWPSRLTIGPMRVKCSN